MLNIVKALNDKAVTNKRNLIFYAIYALIFAILLFFGISGNIHAASVSTAQSHVQSQRQFRQQNKPRLVKQTTITVHYVHHQHYNWFRDGLSNRNLKARNWVSWHESNHRWRVLSYGGRCVGYFQLDPRYLGYRHGHVNLNHRHQVKVADAYARTRYGNWVNAKGFWQVHHWY